MPDQLEEVARAGGERLVALHLEGEAARPTSEDVVRLSQRKDVIPPGLRSLRASFLRACTAAAGTFVDSTNFLKIISQDGFIPKQRGGAAHADPAQWIAEKRTELRTKLEDCSFEVVRKSYDKRFLEFIGLLGDSPLIPVYTHWFRDSSLAGRSRYDDEIVKARTALLARQAEDKAKKDATMAADAQRARELDALPTGKFIAEEIARQTKPYLDALKRQLKTQQQPQQRGSRQPPKRGTPGAAGKTATIAAATTPTAPTPRGNARDGRGRGQGRSRGNGRGRAGHGQRTMATQQRPQRGHNDHHAETDDNYGDGEQWHGVRTSRRGDRHRGAAIGRGNGLGPRDHPRGGTRGRR